MMPFSTPEGYPEKHFDKVYEQIIKPVIEEAGYDTYRVDEDRICDSIIDKIFEGIQNCEMALCDLSGRNPNVLYELGLRQAYDKPVVLIKDEKTEKIFDVSGISTVPYNSTRLYEEVMDARKRIYDALTATSQGKQSSIVKIVKAKSAKFPEGELSHDDTTQILLRSILSQVSELQRNNYEHMKQLYIDKLCRSEEAATTYNEDELNLITEVTEFQRTVEKLENEKNTPPQKYMTTLRRHAAALQREINITFTGERRIYYLNYVEDLIKKINQLRRMDA